jgi:hypothetical protein
LYSIAAVLMKQATGIRWLKRLFSTQQAAPAFPVAVLELLQSGAPVQVQKVSHLAAATAVADAAAGAAVCLDCCCCC